MTDNICNRAATRISGLLKTADIEPSVSDKALIERLQKTNVIEPDVVDRVLNNAMRLHRSLDAPIPLSQPDEVEIVQTTVFPPIFDQVNHPAHYGSHPSGVECIQVAEHMNFNIGNAVKYLWRSDLKNDAIEDLKKAHWYVAREIERREARP